MCIRIMYVPVYMYVNIFNSGIRGGPFQGSFLTRAPKNHINMRMLHAVIRPKTRGIPEDDAF